MDHSVGYVYVHRRGVCNCRTDVTTDILVITSANSTMSLIQLRLQLNKKENTRCPYYRRGELVGDALACIKLNIKSVANLSPKTEITENNGQYLMDVIQSGEM